MCSLMCWPTMKLVQLPYYLRQLLQQFVVFFQVSREFSVHFVFVLNNFVVNILFAKSTCIHSVTKYNLYIRVFLRFFIRHLFIDDDDGLVLHKIYYSTKYRNGEHDKRCSKNKKKPHQERSLWENAAKSKPESYLTQNKRTRNERQFLRDTT